MLFPHLNHTPHINTLCKNAHVNPTGWTFLDFLSDPPWSGSIVCHLAKPKVVELFSFLLCWRTLIPGERWFGRMTISAKNKPTSDLSFDLQKQASFIHFQSQRPSKDGSKKPTIPAAGTGWNPQTPRNQKKTSTRISGSALRLHYWDVQSSLSISRLAGQFRHHFLFLVFLSKDRGNISSQYASLAHAKRQKLGNENHIQNLSSKSFPVGTRNVSLSQATQVLRSYLFLQVLQGTNNYIVPFILVGGFNFPENICSSLENHPLKMVETMNSSNHQPDHDAFRGEKKQPKKQPKKHPSTPQTAGNICGPIREATRPSAPWAAKKWTQRWVYSVGSSTSEFGRQMDGFHGPKKLDGDGKSKSKLDDWGLPGNPHFRKPPWKIMITGYVFIKTCYFKKRHVTGVLFIISGDFIIITGCSIMISGYLIMIPAYLVMLTDYWIIITG